MADLPITEPGEGHESNRPPGWVLVSGAVALVLLVVFVASHLAGGGFGHDMHGGGMPSPAAAPAVQRP